MGGWGQKDASGFLGDFPNQGCTQCAHIKAVVLLMLNKEFHGFAAGIHVPCIDGGLFGGTIHFSQNLITEIP